MQQKIKGGNSMKKLNKRLLSLVLAICLVLSMAAPVAAAPAG